ncbi:hypothetical protein [Ferrimicrobium sp.]|nr:hypothetical protein [Ferrimicrobium sp.]
MIEYEGLMALTWTMASFANGEKQPSPIDVTAHSAGYELSR